MLRNFKDLEGYAVGATDGTIGHVEDFFFDDRAWVVRYLVVDTGTWLSSRKVLLSPIAIGRADWTEKVLHVLLTREQVKNSPDIDAAKPVSRQHEVEHFGYYGYPYYWGGAGYWGGGMYPNLMLPDEGGFGSAERRARKNKLPTRGPNWSGAARMIRTCEAVERFCTVTSMPPMAISATSRACSSTTRRGPSDTWSSTPATGGSVIG